MVLFALMVMISIVAASVWITRRMLERDEVAVRPKPVFVPLDDAPPGVLDAIVRQLQQRPDTA